MLSTVKISTPAKRPEVPHEWLEVSTTVVAGAVNVVWIVMPSTGIVVVLLPTGVESAAKPATVTIAVPEQSMPQRGGVELEVGDRRVEGEGLRRLRDAAVRHREEAGEDQRVGVGDS